MKLKMDAKFREESTCSFKIGIRNLTNFDPKKVSKMSPLMGSFYSGSNKIKHKETPILHNFQMN